MYADIQLASLRKAYQKNLWLNLSAAIMSLLFVGYMLVGEVISDPLMACIAAGVGAIAAVADYAIERALYRKGKNAFFVMVLCMVLPLLALGAVVTLGRIPWTSGASFLPYVAAFIFLRAAIPLIRLLRDGSRLRENAPCETVGAVKKNTRRVEGERAGESYLLFEDELTREVHLLRVNHLSPAHRYRVFYLPHSGLAVGEEIPDDVTFDPFGNPTRREVSEETVEEAFSYAAQGSYTEKPEYNEDGGYAPKTDDSEDESNTARAFCDEPYTSEGSGETVYRDSRYDPNSPERQKAAKYATAAKVCKVLTFLCFGMVFVGAISAKVTDASPLLIFFFIPLIIVTLLNSHFKHQELKLRCTERAIAVCIDTVRRRSGKHSHLHPIVEYEAEGVRHTAELSVTCTRGAVGETYTIYYDPLAPDTVRVG